MSPASLALAIGLHAFVIAGLWWASPLRRVDHYETPIMISMEPEPLSVGNTATPAGLPPTSTPSAIPPTPPQAAPAEPVEPTPPEVSSPPGQQAALAPAELTPPPPPEPAPEAAPSPPEPVAAIPPPPVPVASSEPPAPPAPVPAPVPAPAPASAESATPLPAPAETQAATTPPERPSEAETEATWQTDASSWKPQVTLEPQAEMPPRRTQVRPVSRPPTAPRLAQTPGKRLEDYPPQTSSLGPPSSGSMDGAMADGGARNDYLSRVYRHIEPYRSYPAAARAGQQHGRVVTRVTINRDGGLVDLRLDRSSGWPLIDEAEMAAIRRAMPLPPVPNGMRGDPVVLVLPMNY